MPLFDYECKSCGNFFEEQRKIDDRHTAQCGECGDTATLTIAKAAMLDPRMGTSPDFPTAYAQWERKRIARATGRTKDANNTRFGTNADVERDAYNLRKKLAQ